MTIKEFKIQNALGLISYDMKWRVAKNPNTLKGILETLSTDENIGVRYEVAKNLNTPIKILKILSKDSDWYVKGYVSNNPNTPKEIAENINK